MSQPILVKVYGNIWPAGENLQTKLQKSLDSALVPNNVNPLSLEGDLLLLSFEGIFFPIEDFIATLDKSLNESLQGKIDYLDLEKWRMTRYLIKEGQIAHNSVSLNQVMDYSGF